MNGITKHYIENEIEIVELKNTHLHAKIAINIGCTMYSLSYQNHDVLYFNDTLSNYKQHKKLAGIPFMYPWSNRLESDMIFRKKFVSNDTLDKILFRDGNGLPLHGLLLKTDKWKVEKIWSDDTCVGLSASLLFDDETLLSIFPYPHKVNLAIILENNCVEYLVSIERLDNIEIPLAFGFHPYFNLLYSHKNSLHVPQCKVALVDDKMIPTHQYLPSSTLFDFKSGTLDLHQKNIDNAFIHDDDGEYSLQTENYTVSFSLDKDYEVVQIYQPNDIEKPYICIEPMLDKANAFNELNYKKTNLEKYSVAFKLKIS